jgi:malonate transporter and related proteins
MLNLLTVLNVTLPFFALVFCGWLAARSHLLPESAIPGLNAFVLYFALPCLLFRFGMNTPMAQLLNPAVLAVWLVCAALIIALTIGVTMGPTLRLKDAAFGALVAAFPNTGFMGVPLLVALLGEAAAGPVIATIVVDLLFTTSLCVGLAHAHAPALPPQAPGSRQQRHDVTSPPSSRAVPAIQRSFKGALSNPLPWAVMAGACFSWAEIKLAGPPYAVMSMLADAASPVALFTIGAVMWRAGQHLPSSTVPPRRASKVLPVVAIKLLLHPLLVLAVARLVQHLGFALTWPVVTALVLTAALPSASNVSILAERFGADNGRIATIILVSTALAFATFSVLAWMFGAGRVA